ncbi:MAG: hypothetical protein P9L97_07420 [Candidatus Tenebribacter davisii]|nr:hypothetical protein [Candidatus Tenebribacter davisii]
MNKDEKRQIVDEIYFLGKSKQHRSTFIKAMKGAILLSKLEKILMDKRKAYNYQYTNIFKKYSVKHDDLYGELDKIWTDSLLKEVPTKQKAEVVEVATALGSATALASLGSATTAAFTSAFFSITLTGLFGPVMSGFLLFRLVRVQVKVWRLWKNYKENCRKFAEDYVEKL